MRHLIAAVVWKLRPTLFLYASDKQRRQGIRATEVGDRIDVTRADRRQVIRLSRANALYLPLVAESFDYFFNSAEPVRVRIRGQDWQLLDFSTPRLHSVVGFEDFPVLCPSLTEPFVTNEQYLEFAALQPGHVALDLGAYCGLSSIVFSRAVGGSGRVVALEPDPLNKAAAVINVSAHLRVNGLDNIAVMEAVVADRPGTLEFSSEGAMGSALTSITGRYRGKAVKVTALTSQNIVDQFALDRVDFIKMDIEGAELPVILGSGEFLSRYRPRLVIEPHFIDGALTSEPIVSFLQSVGYQCEVIKQIGLLSLPLITATPPTSHARRGTDSQRTITPPGRPLGTFARKANRMRDQQVQTLKRATDAHVKR